VASSATQGANLAAPAPGKKRPVGRVDSGSGPFYDRKTRRVRGPLLWRTRVYLESRFGACIAGAAAP